MKSSLQAGLSTKRSFHVGRDSTIGFMGEDARVYATPMLVRDIEIACRDLLLAHLDAGEDSVGTRVGIDHLAPTLEGADVAVEVKLAERFIVDVAKTKARLQKKRAAQPS
jgi:predicted thioesterase